MAMREMFPININSAPALHNVINRLDNPAPMMLPSHTRSHAFFTGRPIIPEPTPSPSIRPHGLRHLHRPDHLLTW